MIYFIIIIMNELMSPETIFILVEGKITIWIIRWVDWNVSIVEMSIKLNRY